MPSTPFHPDLRWARFLPRTSVTAGNLPLFRALSGLAPRDRRDPVEVAPVGEGTAVRVFRPAASDVSGPAMLWIHGGGYVSGSARQDDAQCRRFAAELGITVAAVEYRLAPEHPFPTPLHDCYAGLTWLAAQPQVDADRIAIGGASAGGGLAAALALLAAERGEVRPAFQLLSYPMLDDRTTQRSDVPTRHLRLWSTGSNMFGWASYLGMRPGSRDVPPLAAPARYEDLSGVAPAWIGVGTLDLFHDEDVAYAERLRAAGVGCTLEVVPGAYHGFDVVEARAGVSRNFLAARTAVLREALRA